MENEEQEIFKIPALYATKVYGTISGTCVRLTFVEDVGMTKIIAVRAAVAMDINTVKALQDFLNKVIQAIESGEKEPFKKELLQ